jgi:hypothetical protein
MVRYALIEPDVYRAPNGQLICLAPGSYDADSEVDIERAIGEVLDELLNPTITLDTLKRARKAQVSELRDTIAYREFRFGPVAPGVYWWFDADSNSRDNIAGLVNGINAKLPITYPILWRDADNQDRSLPDAATAIGLGGTLLAHVQQSFRNSHQLKDAIAAAASETELNAIDLTAGWPPTRCDVAGMVNT